MLKTLLAGTALLLSASAAAQDRSAALDRAARTAMAETGAQGLAIAFIDRGKVRAVGAYGIRNARGDPLTPDTIMYGASLTKVLFAWFVMQLAEEGKVKLDASVAELDPDLVTFNDPEGRYADYTPLAADPRWRKLTPRILLTHSGGFANFGFLEPDGKLKIHFEPGSRYAYSGDGLILLQYALEQRFGFDLGAEMQRRIFDRFGMTRTSMTWRSDYASDLADGWKADGSIEPHDERSKPRAAGSMDTTITDMANFAAAYVRGEGLRPASRRELTRGQMPINSASQFPSLQAEAAPEARVPGLSAGLGVVTFTGPQGSGFFKGGHNDSTGNTWVCLERGQRCVVILSNDVRAEAAFPAIVRSLLGDTGMPWRWEYGQQVWAK